MYERVLLFMRQLTLSTVCPYCLMSPIKLKLNVDKNIFNRIMFSVLSKVDNCENCFNIKLWKKILINWVLSAFFSFNVRNLPDVKQPVLVILM